MARSRETTTLDDLAVIEAALTAIVRRANLPRLHDRLVQRAGVTLDRAAYVALSRIGEWGPVRLTDLAQQLGVDISTASRQVKQLDHAGLVVRRADPADGRSTALELSVDGANVLAALQDARRAALADLLDAWDGPDRAHLARLLDRLALDIARFSEDQ